MCIKIESKPNIKQNETKTNKCNYIEQTELRQKKIV